MRVTARRGRLLGIAPNGIRLQGSPREELRACFDEAAELVDPAVLMVQELIPGGGATQLSYAALVRDGEPLAALTARRTRQYPADFGRASTYVETASVPDIVEPSTRFLRRIRRDVRSTVASFTDSYQYTIDRLLETIIDRCREHNLRLTDSEEATKSEFMVFLTVQTMNYLHSGRHRVAL